MLRPFEMQSRACISSPAVNRGLRVLEPSFFDSKSIRLPVFRFELGYRFERAVALNHYCKDLRHIHSRALLRACVAEKMMRVCDWTTEKAL